MLPLLSTAVQHERHLSSACSSVTNTDDSDCEENAAESRALRHKNKKTWSDGNSNVRMTPKSGQQRFLTHLYLINSAADDAELAACIAVDEQLKLEVTALGSRLAFVLDDFDSADFKYFKFLNKTIVSFSAAQYRILSPTAIRQLSLDGETEIPSPKPDRPIYCYAMRRAVIWLHWKDRNLRRSKQELLELVDQVHYMGGSIRKEFTKNVTHSLTKTVQSQEYHSCVTMGKPAMAPSWVRFSWQNRTDLHFSATEPEVIKSHKVPPFFGLRLLMLGFKTDELDDVKQETERCGGQVFQPSSESDEKENKNNNSDVGERSRQPSYPTHVVVHHVALKAHQVDQQIEETLANLPVGVQVHVVNEEWFWVSIQLDLCGNEVLFEISTVNGKPIPQPSGQQLNGIRKKKLDGRRSNESIGLDASSESSAVLPEHVFSTDDIEALVSTPRKGMSKRQRVCTELLQTERSYVDVLRTMDMIRGELEKANSTAGQEPLLTKAEMTLIFSKLPRLLTVHERVCAELTKWVGHWSEDRQIGAVWIKEKEELKSCYPPFVNTFDQAKETLVYCDSTRPKFHAFLKACQARSECRRQSLKELMIRPVQRLPSVQLLLSDILKSTEKSNPDHALLQLAIEEIKGVLKHINENKRKTEDRIKIFDIFNEVENCPALIVSGQRQFMGRLDAVDLCAKIGNHKGAYLTLYLFNDILQVTKRRHRTLRHQQQQQYSCADMSASVTVLPGSAAGAGGPEPNVGSPVAGSVGPGGPSTPVIPSQGAHSRKHIEYMFLTSVLRVVDLGGYGGSRGLFCLFIRQRTEDITVVLYADTASETDRTAFLKDLCEQAISTGGRSDIGPHPISDFYLSALDVDSTKELNRALKQRTSSLASSSTSTAHLGSSEAPGGVGLQRTLSFSKSHQGTLRRAISHMTLGLGGTLKKKLSRSNLPTMEQLNSAGEMPPPNTPGAGSTKGRRTLFSSISKRRLPSAFEVQSPIEESPSSRTRHESVQ